MLKNRFLGILVASACAGLAIGSVVAAPLGGGIAHAQGEAQAASLIPDAVIAEFNATVSSTDMAQRVAGGKAAIAAAIAHPTDPNAATLVFEGGFLLCRSGACPEAQVAVDFLNGPAAGGWPAEEVQGLAALVGRSQKDTRASRKALDEAAEALLADGEPSLLMIRLVYDRMADLAEEARFQALGKLAERAAEKIEGMDAVAPVWWDYKLAALTSRFNDEPKSGMFEQAMRLERELESIRQSNGQDRQHWSEGRFWHAQATRMAFGAWMASAGMMRVTEQRQIEIAVQEEIPLVEAAVDNEEPMDDLPSCEFVTTQMPEPVFPRGEARDGRVGAVLIRFVMEDGQVRDPEILAAVPSGRFAEAALKAMEDMQFGRSGAEPDGTCEFRRENIVIPFVFQLARRG